MRSLQASVCFVVIVPPHMTLYVPHTVVLSVQCPEGEVHVLNTVFKGLGFFYVTLICSGFFSFNFLFFECSTIF